VWHSCTKARTRSKHCAGQPSCCRMTPEALRHLGAALHDQGQWAAAWNTLRQALAIEPDNTDALVDAADALRGPGRAREAVPLYERALSLSPQRVEARNNLGNAFSGTGQYADAVSCYRLALGLKPGDAQVVCNLGNASTTWAICCATGATSGGSRQSMRSDRARSQACRKPLHLGNVLFELRQIDEEWPLPPALALQA